MTQPRQGDKVAVGLDSLGNEILIPYHAQSPDKPLLDPIYDYLLTFDVKTGGFTPGLATSWSITPDGLKWTMKLREGVKFSDGGEFTAADVRFYVEKMLDPKSRQPFLATWSAAIGAVQESSKYDVTINFKGLFAGFAEQISDFWQFPVMSKSYFDKVGESGYQDRPVGSGPYSFASRSAGYSYTLRAVERHWRIGVPGFKEFTYFKVPEASTRLAALRTGQFDAMYVPLAQAKQVEELRDIQLRSTSGTFVSGLFLGGIYPPTHPKYNPNVPFLKLEVRKALNLAIDRQAIIDSIMAGRAKPATVFPFLVPGWDELKPYPYDPTQAKQLLANAGYARGFEITAWSVPVVAEDPAAVLATCGFWGEIGVRCNIRPTDFGSFFPRWRSFDNAGEIHSYGSPARPDFEPGMRTVISHNQSVPGYWDKEAADLVDTLAKVADPAERARIYRKIGQIAYERYLSIPLVVPDVLVALGPKIARDWQPLVRYYVSGWETLRPSLAR